MSFFHATKQERRDKKAADQFLAVTAARDQRRAFFRALKDGVIPPTIGLTEPDPECDLDYVPLTKRQAQCDLALSISLGFGGHNGCIALRRAEQ